MKIILIYTDFNISVLYEFNVFYFVFLYEIEYINRKK